jgi:(p)ppGpp synthase/HD superfamily hydrolase
MQFTIQVADRVHLSQVMRALRRIPEVVRLARTKERVRD